MILKLSNNEIQSPVFFIMRVIAQRKYLVLMIIFTLVSSVVGQKTNKSFIDDRDKREYKIVQIGSQVWMAENMKFRPANTQKFWCYDDDEKNCEKYGVLYAWEAAIEVCPQGWRMPNAEDWDKLQNTLKDKKNAEIGKTMMNKNGFNAVFGGFRQDSGRFVLLDEHALFWSNEIDTTYSEQAQKFGRYFGRHLYSDKTTVKFEPSRGKPDLARSLRCLKN